MDEEEKRRHDEAIAEGYKDETCPQCGATLLAHHHFIRCGNRPCAMSSGQSLLDMWLDPTRSTLKQEDAT